MRSTNLNSSRLSRSAAVPPTPRRCSCGARARRLTGGAVAPVKAEARARCPRSLQATSGALQPAAALARGEMGCPSEGVLAGEARRHGEEERPGRCLCSRRRGATLAGARVRSAVPCGRAGGGGAVRSRPVGRPSTERTRLGSWGPGRNRRQPTSSRAGLGLGVA